jgi:RNA polymerase sigma-70 factor (ECF subfamily)
MVISVTQSAEATDARSQQALFERLLQQTSRQAYALAYRLTGNAAEAEDLVQDTYIRAFRFFHRYDQSLSFTSWLYRIMANTHIDTMRRKVRFKLTSIDQTGANGTTTWDFADPEPTAEKAMLDGAVGDKIQDALNAMTPEFRTAVVLADVEGMAYEEIADAMNTSVGTVRSRIHRGRKQIRRHLLVHAPGEYARMSE